MGFLVINFQSPFMGLHNAVLTFMATGNYVIPLLRSPFYLESHQSKFDFHGLAITRIKENFPEKLIRERKG